MFALCGTMIYVMLKELFENKNNNNNYNYYNNNNNKLKWKTKVNNIDN